MNRSRPSLRRTASSTCSTAGRRRIRSRRSPTASRRSTRARCRRELIVFKGQPDFVPIVGTQLLWASNTTSDVLIDTANNNYYVLLAGRWFTSPALTGPWTFVASNALPADFAKIPAQSLAGAVLPTVAGTPQAQEAVIENSIPQTATVPLKNGPKFTPNFDGPPQYAPIPGTPLSYVAELVGADHPGRAEFVLRGRRRRVVHGDAADRTVDRRDVGADGDLHDPAVVADLLRDLRAHLRGDAAVRLRRLHAGLSRHGGFALRHGRLRHRLRRMRRGSAACGIRRRTPTASPRRRSTTRMSASPTASRWDSPPPPGPSPTGAAPTTIPATGAATRAAGRRARTSTATGAHHVLRTRARGTRAAASPARPPAATTTTRAPARPAATTPAASTTRTPATPRAATTARPTARPAAPATSRAPATTTPTRASARPARASRERVRAAARTSAAGATTAGPEGDAHVGDGSTYNAKTGKTNTWGTASVGNNHYADVNGNVYKNNGNGWQQHSSSGWGGASGDTSWADQRIAGAQLRCSDWGGRGGFGGGDRSFGGGGFGAAASAATVPSAVAVAAGAVALAAVAVRWRRLRRRRIRRRRPALNGNQERENRMREMGDRTDARRLLEEASRLPAPRRTSVRSRCSLLSKGIT